MNLVQLKQKQNGTSSQTGTYLKFLIKQRMNSNPHIQSRILSNSISYITAREYIRQQKHLKEFGKIVTESVKLGDMASRRQLMREMNGKYRDIGNSTCFIDLLDTVFPNFSHTSCYDCSDVGCSHDFYGVENDFDVCHDCRDNYYWNNAQGYYQRDEWFEDDDEYDDDSSCYNNLGSYHSSKRHLGHFPSSFDNRKPKVLLGLELEM